MICQDRQQDGIQTGPAMVAVAAMCLLTSPGCDSAALAIVAHGFLTKIHTNAAIDNRRYVVFVPYNRDPNQRLPVILFLNGRGENGNDGQAGYDPDTGLEGSTIGSLLYPFREALS